VSEGGDRFDPSVREGFTFGGLILCRLLLDAAYAWVVAPQFGYMGLTYDPDPQRYLESWLLTMAVLLASPLSIRRPSDVLVFLLVLTTVLPFHSLYGLTDSSRTAVWSMTVGVLIVVLLRRLRTPTLPTPRIPVAASALGLLGLLGVTAAAMVGRGGMSSFNLDVLDVYEFRDESNERFAGWVAYLVLWSTKVVNPALTILAVARRRWLLVLLFVGVQILLFGMASHRAILAYPIIAGSLYWLSSKRWGLALVAGGFTTLLILAMAAFEWGGNSIFASLLVRRAFFVPGYLNFAYYDFFSAREFVHLSNSVLAGWIPYPYPAPPQAMVGAVAFPAAPDSWANAGFLASGYMQFGVPGVLLYSATTGLLLKIADGMIGRLASPRIGLAVVSIPFLILFTTADLPTTLLSHGLLLAMALLWVLPGASRANESGPGGDRVSPVSNNPARTGVL